MAPARRGLSIGAGFGSECLVAREEHAAVAERPRADNQPPHLIGLGVNSRSGVRRRVFGEVVLVVDDRQDSLDLAAAKLQMTGPLAVSAHTETVVGNAMAPRDSFRRVGIHGIGHGR